MHQSVMGVFQRGILTVDEVAGKRVLEVGSYDVNGSVRPILEGYGPASYLGVDSMAGPGVDRVVDCVDLLAMLPGPFDVVVTTEMLEHVADWRACILNLVAVVADGGLLVLTAQGTGFPYHGHPEDHWRFTPKVIGEILETVGFEVLDCYPDPDPESPGVIAKARKPVGWTIPATGLSLDAIEVEPAPEPGPFAGIPAGFYYVVEVDG